jgi:hypothetical protein
MVLLELLILAQVVAETVEAEASAVMVVQVL